MVHIRTTDRKKVAGGSPKGEVGEIDTRAPFQSVKAAVSLFGEVAVSRGRRTPRRSKQSSENVIDNETQLLLARKEHQRLKQQLDNAENTRSKVLAELDKANKMLKDLSSKLKGINELKLTAIEAREAVKAKQLEHSKSVKYLGRGVENQEIDDATKHYTFIVSELNVAKQELNIFRQDFDAALEEKLAAFQQAAEAQHTTNMHSEKVTELQKEIETMRETAQQLKFATIEAQDEQIKIWAEKEHRKETHKISKEEAQNKLKSLKNQYDPELTKNLELKFAETSVEIKNLQEEMKKAHASQMKVVKIITARLNEASRTLQQVVEEETSARNIVNVLKQELENVRMEREEFERLELEKLTSESRRAKEQVKDVKKNVESLKQDAENTRKKGEELEKKLQLALANAEKAKAAEAKVCDEMKAISQIQGIENQDSPIRKIRISAKDLETLRKKAEQSSKVGEETVVLALAKMEVIKASKEAADKKTEANLKAIEEIKIATNIALKGAVQGDTVAQSAIVGELLNLREDQVTNSV
ncbi:hypothetical protein ACFE04_029773 [Oxalis oulophora]